MSARALATLVALAAIGVHSEALAQTKQECVDAYTSAQLARSNGKLKEARDKLLLCTNASCPAALRRDCVPWLGEVDAVLPTLAVKPVDDTGRVVDGANVSVDGRSVPREGDAAVLRVDPGEHVVRVEAEGLKTTEQHVTLAAGGSRREVVVRLVRAAATVPGPEPVSEPARPIPTTSFVLGAVGVVGVGAFAVLGAIGSGKKGDLDTKMCKPNCAQSDVDAIKTDYVAADVALGVGVAALAGAFIVFLMRPAAAPAKSTPEAARRLVPIVIAPHRGGASLVVRF